MKAGKKLSPELNKQPSMTITLLAAFSFLSWFCGGVGGDTVRLQGIPGVVLCLGWQCFVSLLAVLILGVLVQEPLGAPGHLAEALGVCCSLIPEG